MPVSSSRLLAPESPASSPHSSARRSWVARAERRHAEPSPAGRHPQSIWLASKPTSRAGWRHNVPTRPTLSVSLSNRSTTDAAVQRAARAILDAPTDGRLIVGHRLQSPPRRCGAVPLLLDDAERQPLVAHRAASSPLGLSCSRKTAGRSELDDFHNGRRSAAPTVGRLSQIVRTGSEVAVDGVAARPREREPRVLAGRPGLDRQQVHRRLPQPRQRRAAGVADHNAEPSRASRCEPLARPGAATCLGVQARLCVCGVFCWCSALARSLCARCPFRRTRSSYGC